MQRVHSRGGDVSEHPAPAQPVCSQSPSTQTNQPEPGFGGDKAVQRATSLHHITSVYKMYKSYCAIFSQGLPKVLLSPPRAEICREAQVPGKLWGGKEAGKGSSAAGWERIARGDPLWLLRMVLRGQRWEAGSGGRCCVRSGCHPLLPSRRVCTHGLVTPLRVAAGGLAGNHFSLLSHPLLLIHSPISSSFEDGETNVPEVLLKGRVEVKKSVWVLLGTGKAKIRGRKKIKPLGFTNLGGSFFGSSFWIISVWSHLLRSWGPPA